MERESHSQEIHLHVVSQNNHQLKCPRCGSNWVIKYGKTAHTKKQNYQCRDCEKVFHDDSKCHISAGNTLPPNITLEAMFELNIWDLRVMGLQPTPTGAYTLNFSLIQPDWLKTAAKEWIKYQGGSGSSTGTLIKHMQELRRFSRFIQNHQIHLKPKDINRKLIVNFLMFVSQERLGVEHKRHAISSIKVFLENCQRFIWLDLPKELLFYPEDFPKHQKRLPRYIPNEVIKQLEDNLDALPKPIERAIKVLRGTGMRISELVILPLNCIQQDSTGSYWLRIYQPKMKKEISLIIERDLAEKMREQQDYIKENIGEDFNYLFCETHHYYSIDHTRNDRQIKPLNYFEPMPQKMNTDTIRAYLRRLAEEREIRDASGKIFPLGKCHQFRHTHGTELINAGVPQHIVQKRLGHASPTMTSVYAHIHDETMKQEMEKFWDGKVVDIRGEVVISENPDLDTAEMQWIKKNMKAQALPNGFCGLPVTQSCPVQGSPCLVCSHFRTTKEHVETHKKQLENTENIIKKATAKGWHRQVETNEPIAQNLRNIIQGIEGEVNNA